MKSNLLHDLATRLAATCKNLGLDDADEDLLWRYLMELPNGSSVPREIADTLYSQSTFVPVAITSYSWTATFPERFHKPKPRRWLPWLPKAATPLEASGSCEFNNPSVYVRSFAGYEAGLIDELKTWCFKQWYDDITNCIREDGCNWEPPTASDVQIELKVEKIDLLERLDLLTKSQLM
jgi:hypothetical protein